MADRGWMPIETAPRGLDDRIIVTDGEWVGEVYWSDRWYGDRSNPGWMVANCDEEYGRYIDATHWMPLPTPPEDTGHAILSNTKEGG